MGGNGGQVDTRVFEILDSESSTVPSPPPTQVPPWPRVQDCFHWRSFHAMPDSDTGIWNLKGADQIDHGDLALHTTEKETCRNEQFYSCSLMVLPAMSVVIIMQKNKNVRFYFVDLPAFLYDRNVSSGWICVFLYKNGWLIKLCLL